MPTQVSYAGRNFNIPAPGDAYAWENDLSAYLVALASGGVQASGGTLVLTADQSFGANFGLIAKYYKSISANISQAGVLRLANTDTIGWRNVGNTGNDGLLISPTDDLQYFNATSSVTTTLSGNPYAEYTSTAAQSIPNNVGAYTIINFGTVVTDTDSAVTTGASWKFTVPANKGGLYYVEAICTLGAAYSGTTPFVMVMAVITNPGLVELAPLTRFNSAANAGTAGLAACGSTIVNLAAGTAISIGFLQSSTTGGAIALTATATQVRVVIKRVS